MITAPKILLIDADGKQLGILPRAEARALSEEQGLDLVEVSPNANPPVCRLMDYGKYKYQQSKKLHKKKTLHVVHTKEIKLRPFTGQHDFEVKLRHILEFLDRGNKVKISVIFRGRESMHTERGKIMLDKITEEIKQSGNIERAAHMEGRNMVMVLSPKKTG